MQFTTRAGDDRFTPRALSVLVKMHVYVATFYAGKSVLRQLAAKFRTWIFCTRLQSALLLFDKEHLSGTGFVLCLHHAAVAPRNLQIFSQYGTTLK